MKVELEDVYKLIDEEYELWNKRAVSNNKLKVAHSALIGAKKRLQYRFPEYVLCLGGIINQFGGALAILSNDSSTLRDVRVLRLKPQQAREKLETGEITFTGGELGKYLDMLKGPREVSVINRAVMTKQDFIKQYLTEEATEDDK